jgi:hypothetical protein
VETFWGRELSPSSGQIKKKKLRTKIIGGETVGGMALRSENDRSGEDVER